MRLIVDNVRCIITELTLDERRCIRQLLSKSDPRTGFNRGSFDPNKVKTEKFYLENKSGMLIFTGLLPEIQKVLKSNKVSIDNHSTSYNYQSRDYTYDELRSYFNPNFSYVEHQIRALREMLKRTKGIVKATTSAGKTEIILAFIKLTKLKTIIIAPKVDLANQLFERACKAGLDVGLMTGSSKKYKGEQVCIATPQMAIALSDRDFDCVICDECHHVCSSTYQDFFKRTKSKVMFGFSATPDTNKVDFMKIRQFLGSIITEIGATELVEHNVIVYPKINFIPISQHNTGDWQSANDDCIIYNNDRNNKIKELSEESEKPVLILIRNIEHGEELNKNIPDSVFLSGRDENKLRNEVFEKYENGEIGVLIGTYGILSEGISLNSIKTLIIAGGGKSDIQTTQALGRALRSKEGKKEAVIYDFVDMGNKFLEKHSLQRAKIYKQIGFPSEILKKQVN